MKWDDLNWDDFSCVDMTRKIKEKIDAVIEDMTPNEVCEYLHKSHIEFINTKSLTPLQQQKLMELVPQGDTDNSTEISIQDQASLPQ